VLHGGHISLLPFAEKKINLAEYISASPDLRDNFQLLNYSDWEHFENDTVFYLSTSVIGRHVPLWGSKL